MSERHTPEKNVDKTQERVAERPTETSGIAVESATQTAPLTAASSHQPKAPAISAATSKLQRIHTDRYLTRELSWLEFNARVLEESLNHSVPLLERLKFISIFMGNLDEFFMVRVAGLRKMVQEDIKSSSDSPDELPGEEILEQIRKRVMEMSSVAYEALLTEVLPALASEGVEIVSVTQLPNEARATLAQYFSDNVLPVLTPLAVDPAHPFPFLTNLAQYLVVLFKDINYNSQLGAPPIGLVEIPSVLPRLIPVSWKTEKKQFVLLEDLIKANIGKIFMGYELADAHPIRVTRNLDYTLLENEVVDLLKSVQRELTNREHQEAVRLELGGKLPKNVMEILKRELHVTSKEIYESPEPLLIPGLMTLYHLPMPNLKDPAFNPRCRCR